MVSDASNQASSPSLNSFNCSIERALYQISVLQMWTDERLAEKRQSVLIYQSE